MDIERSPKLHFSNKKPPLPPPVSLFSHKIKLKVPKESFISANSTDIDTSYVDGGHKFLEKFKRKKESILSLSQQYLEFLEQEEEKEEVSVFHHNFEKVEFLGKGQFCNVYQAVHKLDGKRYAIKVTNHTIKNVKPRGQVKNEAQILAALSVLEEGKNIVRYYNSWMEKKDLYLQMEYCDKTLDRLMPLSLSQLKQLIIDIARALKTIHDHKIVHLDIKPDNILFSSATSTFKLADFGLARTSVMTPFEDVLEGDSRFVDLLLLNNPSDLPKADIFSFGASLYSIVLGVKLPENGLEWQRIRRGGVDGMNGMVPEYIKTLIKRMMSPDLAHRPSANEILSFMERSNGFRSEPIIGKERIKKRDVSA